MEKCTLIQRRFGGWIAVSGKGEKIKIGVTGDSEAEAREKYNAAISEWKKLLAEESSEAAFTAA